MLYSQNYEELIIEEIMGLVVHSFPTELRSKARYNSFSLQKYMLVNNIINS